MNAKDRERRFRRLKEIGCIVCRSTFGQFIAAEIHHLNLGGKAGQKRRGDEFTVPLCKWHHQQHVPPGYTLDCMIMLFGPSLKTSRLFRATFGTDDELLEATNKLIAKYEAEAA